MTGLELLLLDLARDLEDFVLLNRLFSFGFLLIQPLLQPTNHVLKPTQILRVEHCLPLLWRGLSQTKIVNKLGGLAELARLWLELLEQS